ncbi:substrate-binding periplasmic protein [Pseudobacteriovorax antillogorgiicola]|uniref:Extracellular solute-binding protein, family 3 n=1 Tax=Pseudobacteriovorax antillogorgiicola TaxID=1513793 RepID=A0A1Y6CW37_9BACT|nr:transporter substrate-binding domain-containing protein [Pseudobacteriovorax antillogorgiicola]TCS42865.1 extracellular solute-binding protein (family 3) [Pseudobacteriovorax antillogorgiicola]SMF82032.1 extracellular solute-binding protein, family 3 [Pseudobacteriovorax antillogorgiicola]
MRGLTLLLVCLCLASCSHAKADKPLNVLVPEVVITEFYTTILKKALPEAKMIFAPVPRAGAEFRRERAPCFLGTDAPTAKKYFQVDTISSDPFLAWGVGIYTPRDKPKISNLEQLKGKVAVVVRGNNFVSSAQKKFGLAKLYVLSEDKKLFIFLDQGRADVAFYWYPLLRSNRAKIHRDEKLSIHQATSALLCLNKPENQVYIDRFNATLLNLRKSGWLRQQTDLLLQH